MRRVVPLLLLSACTTTEYVAVPIAAIAEPCDTTDHGASSSSTAADASTTADESSSSTTEPLDCPEIVDGTVSFCPPGLGACRNALVVNAGAATSSGPLALYWHGTFESPTGVRPWSPVAEIESMVEAEDGLLVLPYGDPAAAARTNNPFPWWPICGPDGTGCDRTDDFDVADTIIACALEQGLADPERVTVAGLSAGGIMTSLLLEARTDIAAAAVWSGGMPQGRAMVPGGDAAVIVFHGGTRPGHPDVYCGAGSPTTGCYAFQPAAEALALDIVDAGDFAIVCDHDAGHSGSMAGQGAEFLQLGHTIAVPASGSYLDSLQGYPFSGGTRWMLANWGCYDAGETSPWD